MSTLKLKQPDVLPATGVTSVSFKVWRNTTLAFIGQDTAYYHFQAGGQYATWLPLEEGRRISELHENDLEKKELDKTRRDNENDARRGIDEETYNLKRRQMLDARNSQLMKIIQHVVNYVYYTEQDDIIQYCTSMEYM